MDRAYDELLAAILGVVSGFITSIPGGPVNVTILNEGARSGFRRAIIIAVGAMTMESVYCALAFASFAGLFASHYIRATMELMSLLLTLWLGIKYLKGDSLPGEARGLEFAERKLHPHTAFWTGFVRVLGNPGLLVLWLSIAATMLSHDWVADDWACKGAFVGGVALGGVGWFGLVAWGISHGSRRFSPGALRKMAQVSGLFMLGAAAIIATKLIIFLGKR